MGSDWIWKFVEPDPSDNRFLSRYQTVDAAFVMAFESTAACVQFDGSHLHFKRIQGVRSLAHLLPGMFC